MMVGVCLLGERSKGPGELFVGALTDHVSTHAREGLQCNALRKAPWSHDVEPRPEHGAAVV